MWFKQLLRVGIEVGGTVALAESITDMSFERRAEVSGEDQAQFINNVTEYNILKSAIHNGMINHLRQNVFLPKNGKYQKMNANSIDELLHELVPDLEDPTENYEDESAWFGTMRMLHDKRNLRHMNKEQRCFSFEEMKFMSTFPPPEVPRGKNEDLLLQNILSAYAVERLRKRELHKQVDRNFTLLEKEMNRQLDIQDAEEFPIEVRFPVMAFVALVAHMFFKGTDHLLGGSHINIFADKLIPQQLSRQMIYRRFGAVIFVSIFASYMKIELAKNRAKLNAEEDQSDEMPGVFAGLLHSMEQFLVSFEEGDTNSLNELDKNDNIEEEDLEAGFVTIQKAMDLKRNARQFWPGDTDEDPYTIDKRLYYHIALPLTQIFLFNHCLLRSLITYIPGPIAHAVTAMAFVTHAAYTVTPLHYDQSLLEQGYLSGLRTMVLQSWSYFAQYPRQMWPLFLGYFIAAAPDSHTYEQTKPNNDSGSSAVNDVQVHNNQGNEPYLPEPTSYVMENTERYRVLLSALSFVIGEMMYRGGKSLNFYTATSLADENSNSSKGKDNPRIMNATQAQQVLNIFSSDHFTVDAKGKRMYHRDMIDFWLTWEKYIREKQRNSMNQNNNSNNIHNTFVKDDMNKDFQNSGSMLATASIFATKILFPELMRYKDAENHGTIHSNSDSSSTKVQQSLSPSGTIQVNTFAPIVNSVLSSIQVSIMEMVFQDRAAEMSQEHFLSFAHFLTSNIYCPSSNPKLANASADISIGDFLHFVQEQRRVDRTFSEDEILDMVQVTQENLWKADSLFLKYYEPYIFQRVEQTLAGRVKGSIIQSSGREIENTLMTLDIRLSRQLQWQLGMSVDNIRFLLKTYSDRYPSIVQLQKEWRGFYTGPEFITQRLKNIQDVETNLLKRRLYLRWARAPPPPTVIAQQRHQQQDRDKGTK